MPASIRVTLHESPGGVVVGPVTTDSSRNDLRKGYQVVCESVHEANTYSWVLAFTPDSAGPPAASGDDFIGTPSNATLLPPYGSTSQVAMFNVDWDGSYLIRLTVDAGLPTEDTMFLRLRVLTRFADIKLVAAGERRDANGVVPIDASPEGWADDQNQNLNRLVALVRRLSTSGRTLYVDANRGRDNSASQNDHTNILRIPGPDSAALDETGIRLEAEGFADFSAINDAITYAMGAVARGEPALSVGNPYFIRVKPGYYEEDLNLQPHIHLVGESPHAGVGVPGVNTPFITVRTANMGGVTHHFNGASAFDFCFLFNLQLENTGSTDQAVIEHTGGLLVLWDCIVSQRGNAVNQGAAIRSVAGTMTGLTALFDCIVVSEADADDDRYALIFDIPDSSLTLENTRVLAQRSGIRINPSLVANMDLGISRNSVVDVTSGYAIRSAASTVGVSYSTVHASDPDKCIVLDGFGNPPGSMAGSQRVGLLYSRVDRVIFDTAIPVGNTTLRLDATEFLSPGADWVQFPNGEPDTFDTELHDRSIFYDSDYEDPDSPGTPVVPVNSQLNVNNVQDALDLLVQICLPSGNIPFYSLDSAYDGLASVNPLVYGQGLGRVIIADKGAVQITGATPPLSLETDGKLRGGLQMEGVLDLGPLVSDGLGSEVNISANPFTAGPMITMGRAIWPDDFTTIRRGFPAGLIIGGNPEAADTPTDGTIPYNVFLRTRNNFTSPTDMLGTVMLDGGTAMEDPSVPADTAGGGWVFIQGGSVYSATTAEDPGYIVLAPGEKTGAGAGEAKIRIVRPDAATRCFLVAQNVFVGGQAGNFWVATPNGVEMFAVGAGDNLAAVIATINSTSRAVTASNVGGRLRMDGTPFGPNGDVLYIGDDQAGALNTALGELRVNSGANFTPGDFPKYVDIYCDAHGRLRVEGDIHADGDITAGGSCCAGGGGGSSTIYPYHQYTPGPPYVVLPTIRIVGVVTVAGPPVVVLPFFPPDGRVITIKDESGNAAVNPILIDPGPATIDGLGPGPIPLIIVNWASLTMYYSAAAGAWFLM